MSVQPKNGWRFLILALLVLCGTTPAAEPEGGATFDVMEYEIAGNTLLPVATVERAVYRHLGERKSIVDVEKAREALEKAYHDAGYLTVIVDIPPQKVDSGLVTLTVTEGSVHRLRVMGSRYFALGEIRATAPELAEGNVPNFTEVQRELAQLNRSADLRVTPVLKPGTVPGRVDVELKVEDKLPLHGSFEINNRKTGNTTDLRALASVRYDNLWQRQHSIGFQYQTSPLHSSEVSVASMNYVFPLRGTQDVIALYAVTSDSAVAASSTVGVLGKGVIGGVRWIRNLPSPQPEVLAHSFTLGADYKHFREITQLLGSDSFKTPIKYVPLSTLYSATLQDTSGQTQFNGGFNFGLRNLFGLNQDPDFENKRFKAQANYAFLRSDISRNQTLPRGFSLNAKLEFQRASGPLISNEQYGAGGVDSLRGYLEYERFGDNAVLGKLELRTPSTWVGKGETNEIYALFFVEAANLKILEPLPGNAQSYNLSSAGLSIRVKSHSIFQSMLDIGHPFRDGAYTPAGGVRVNFRTLVLF